MPDLSLALALFPHWLIPTQILAQTDEPKVPALYFSAAQTLLLLFHPYFPCWEICSLFLSAAWLFPAQYSEFSCPFKMQEGECGTR